MEMTSRSRFYIMYNECMVQLHFDINSIIQEFSSTTGSNEEIINFL